MMTGDGLRELDLTRLSEDLRQYARIAQVRFNAAVVDKVIDTLADLLPLGWIGVRTTTLPPARRDVNLRLCYRSPVPPVPRLRQAGLLTFTGHPIETLLDEVAERHEPWWGVDASVNGPADKIWMIFDRGIPLEELTELPSIPAAVRTARPHFHDSGMDRAGLLALDFSRRTINVYSPVFTPGTLSPEAAATMLTRLGFPAPEGDLRHTNGQAFDFYQTFGWDHPGLLRLCFPVRCSAEEFPVHHHPLLRDFVEQAPFAAAERNFVFYTTYGPRGGYFKVQSDYTGNHRQTFAATT
uniref:Prenyltransferase n=2 Tax=Streptomyces alanosinicus TaxID=68171 RepID=A0A6B9JFX4_9ACTN|nr:hypothetical protein [Streptomyces alanosinicus]